MQIRRRMANDAASGGSASRVADVYHSHVLLFSDICGFTAYSKSVEPEKVVQMLTALFVKYDKMCSQLEVYKLCTIGDAYICLTEPSVQVSDQYVREGAERML